MPKIDLGLLVSAKIAAGPVRAMKGPAWLWDEPASFIGSFDASALTLTRIFTGRSIVSSFFGGVEADTYNPLVLVFRDVIFPSAWGDYCLFEMGADVIGCAAYITGAGQFVLRAGSGTSALTDPDISGFAQPIPDELRGATTDVTVEFNPSTGAVSTWFGARLFSTIANGAFARWAGNDNGGIYRTDGGNTANRPTGVPATNWPSIGGQLEVYVNQMVNA